MTTPSLVAVVGQVGVEAHVLVDPKSDTIVTRETRPGGCAYFGAVVLSQLGYPPTVVTNTGSGAQTTWIRDRIEPLSGLLVDLGRGEPDRFESRWDVVSGEKSLLCLPGTGITRGDVADICVDDEAGVVVYSAPDPEIYPAILSRLARPGRLTVMVPNQTLAHRPDVLAELCGQASTVIVNLAEAQQLSGQTGRRALVQWCRSLSRTCEIILTDGTNGVIVVGPDDVVTTVEHAGPTVSFGTGTGDMLAAAYTLYRSRGESPAIAVHQAVLATAEAAETVAPFSAWRHP